jgi:hypothetical protein
VARILFVAYGGGHVAMLIPVAKLARELGHEIVFLGLTTALPALQKAGIDAIGFAGLLQHAPQGAAGFGIELAAQLPAGGTVPKEESEAYLGISFADLVAERGEAAARAAYAEHGRHAFLPVAFFERVLAARQPDLVIATNSPRAERAAIVAAGRLGIPSICLVDLFALQEVRWIGEAGYADRICVLNDEVRNMFLRHGRKESELVVTGNPAFDVLNEAHSVGAGAQMRRDRGWDDDRITILWASQVEPERHPFNGEPGDPRLPRNVERELREFVRGHPGFRLVVRYHPSEHETFVPEPHVEFSPRSDPLAGLLHAVDIVVVTCSTVGVEAFLVGRPVVSVDCSVLSPDAPYADMGISRGVKRIADLPVALLDGAETCRQARRKALPAANERRSAAERVMDVMTSTLESAERA